MACIALVLNRAHDTPFPWPMALIYAGIIVLLLLWINRYQRKWQQFRAKDWPTVEGVFVSGEGEVVTMMRGSGYESHLYYEYQRDGEQFGKYTRLFSTEAEAEAFVKLLDGLKVPVRVNQKKPRKSYILDRDVDLLLGPLSGN